MKEIKILLRVLSFAAAVLCSAMPAQAKTLVYVSAAEDGTIDSYRMDKTTGALTPIGRTDAGKLVMPMAVNPKKTMLYAVLRSKPFTLLSFAIDPKTGALTRTASAPLPASMVYAVVDATGRFLLSASYGEDMVAVSKINADGTITTEPIQVLPTGRNAHCILADRSNRFVYASNLGGAHILEYRFDAATGMLSANDPPAIASRPDNGPRHMVVSPDNRYLYVIHELSGNIAQYKIDRHSGLLTEVDYTGTVPADSGLKVGHARAPVDPNATSGANPETAEADNAPKIWAADIQVSPNGRFVYASERTASKIALLSVAPWHPDRSPWPIPGGVGGKVGPAVRLPDCPRRWAAVPGGALSRRGRCQLGRDRRVAITAGAVSDNSL
jgi:6-phosphogluconolactonase